MNEPPQGQALVTREHDLVMLEGLELRSLQHTSILSMYADAARPQASILVVVAKEKMNLAMCSIKLRLGSEAELELRHDRNDDEIDNETFASGSLSRDLAYRLVAGSRVAIRVCNLEFDLTRQHLADIRLFLDELAKLVL